MADDAAHDLELWRHYQSCPNDTARAALVSRYERLVRILAAHTYGKRFSRELEFGDYYQFGMVGLLECIDRFDPERGRRFEAYACRRILGAILNSVTSLSEKQRQISVRQQILRERTASVLEGAYAQSADLFERLGQVALGVAIGLLLEDTGMYASEVGSYPDNSYRSLELRQLQQRVREAVQRLPEQEQRVITLHYLQRWPFHQIAQEQGVTPGRISQVHRSALDRLRDDLPHLR